VRRGVIDRQTTETSIKMTPPGLRVQATPTVVLVDAAGKILAAWEGVGPEKQQAVIREKILSLLN